MPRFPHFVNTKTEIRNSDFRFHSLIREAELCLATEDLGTPISAITAKNTDIGKGIVLYWQPRNGFR